jgi:hypothetical protein
MSYTDENLKEAYFGDLYELSLDEAVAKLHEGLSSPDQATVAEIKAALFRDIKNGDLKLVRGTVNLIGKNNLNPPVLSADLLPAWAEKNGLEIENNGTWFDYMMDEAELAIILEDKLESLRALQRAGKNISELSEIKNEIQQDRDLKIAMEYEKLKAQQAQANKPINPRTEASYLTIICALLDFIEGKTPTINAHPDFKTESKLIDILETQYTGYNGMSKSNLSRVFPKSRRTVNAEK